MIRRPAARRPFDVRLITRLAAGLVLGWLCAPVADAQVVSLDRGVLTLMAGQGSGPIGQAPAAVVAQEPLPSVTQHSVGWRVSGGYNFATYFSAEAGIARIGYLKRSAPYPVSSTYTDTLSADTVLNAVELNLIGRLPLAERFRLDLTVGGALSSLQSEFSTAGGSSLPTGQANPVHVRRFGPDVGLDAEWKLGERLSLIVGEHAYTNVGSNRVVGSGGGTYTLLAAGLHVEF